jgi:hypothetical protein
MENYQFSLNSSQTTDVQRPPQSAAFYIDYMNENVFRPIGVTWRGCIPPLPELGTADILSYPFPAGTTAGTDWGDWTLACGGGGWVLSASDLFDVAYYLANGNVLLTDAEKTQMASDCLGWDCSVRSDCPNPYVCKNGHLDTGSLNVWTYVGIFKCNVPVVLIVNSPLPQPYQSGEDIIGLVNNAYTNAAVAGTPTACP